MTVSKISNTVNSHLTHDLMPITPIDAEGSHPNYLVSNF